MNRAGPAPGPADGGYRFLPGGAAYSAGVATLAGFEIHRARFARPVSVEEGFRRIAAVLGAQGRPRVSLCACELRSPRPFTEEGFAQFNRRYVSILESWGVVQDGVNPVARSNVCPEQDPPESPGLWAFSYTVPGPRAGFVVAGSGEVPEGRPNYRDYIVRRGDVSPEGLAEKARWVLGEQERRLEGLGGWWAQVTGVQIYTVHGNAPAASADLVRRGVPPAAILHERCRPPVVDIEFEMDCRSVARELRLEAS